MAEINRMAADRAAARSRSGGVWSLGHLRICWAALLVAGTALVSVGALISGWTAFWGVLVGTAIVGLFFSVSAIVIAKAGQRNPKMVMPAALGSYVAKIVALGIVLVLMPRDGAIDTRWMAGAIGLGMFCWLGAHMRHVWATKIFYVDPGDDPRPPG
jgi:ATP synthase protein I